MPQPTISDVHVNIPLTNLSLLPRQEDMEFVADRVFPRRFGKTAPDLDNKPHYQAFMFATSRV